MAPGADQAAAENTLQSAVTKLTTEVDRIDPETQKLINAINSALRTASFVTPIGAYLFAKKVQSSLDGLFDKLRELAQEIRKFLSASTPVFSLLHKGFLWTEQVLPQVSGAVGTARDIRPNGLHAWGGEAGRAYMEKRWGQEKGLQGTTNVVKDIGQWLIDVAALNAKFLVDITDPVIDVIEAIIEAAIEIATVFGILEAIDTVAAAIADSIGAVLKMVQEATKHMFDSMSKLSEARGILNNNDFFPGGSWPQAVSR
ncbi:hypothetical protein [Micromonospora endophytica]|uniref:Uncharacterized protein n=1 Tax=Micromonospora endophytica TaxID=515350 RepID=A0A2W2CNR3_9ACTN|nr:hypothetical protein [Micromonospora endophytica]PZF99550.1 hypothetical protein C1I93_05625 [Micromonospora endophytica]RIW46803.1 hypothetical protein D3H59_11040 [Micromonospora endophytica]BCJ59186.1 hypothetical protein Jiend_26080 [Micromonospora endophytica]